MRKNFGAKPWTYPQPVFILAAYDENGTPNAMNAAWGGISEEKELSICITIFCRILEIIQRLVILMSYMFTKSI